LCGINSVAPLGGPIKKNKMFFMADWTGFDTP